MSEVWDSIRNRTLTEWVAGSAVTYTGTKLVKTQSRRGIRNFGAFGKGFGRHLNATYRTMGDFHRANALGNKPFPIEAHVPAIAATGLYVATPVAMIVAAAQYPSIAGPAQSTAATGQIGIGSRAGQQLIFGNMRWSDLLPW